MSNTYPEPYKSAAKDTLVDPSTCYNRECVSYIAWKIRELTGSWPKRTGDMNAKEWIYRLPSWGYKRVAGPKAGGKYVGVLTAGTYGHVVWFESGSTISEYNYNFVGNYSTRSINLKAYIWYEIKSPIIKKSNAVIANEVIAGKWGNGINRINNLKKAGYNPTTIQSIVNSKLNAKPSKPTSTNKYYIVKSGDVAGVIAQKNNISLSMLKKLNPQIKDINKIYPNDKLRVK